MTAPVRVRARAYEQTCGLPMIQQMMLPITRRKYAVDGMWPLGSLGVVLIPLTLGLLLWVSDSMAWPQALLFTAIIGLTFGAKHFWDDRAVLDPLGIRFPHGKRWEFVPYADIEAVERCDARKLVLRYRKSVLKHAVPLKKTLLLDERDELARALEQLVIESGGRLSPDVREVAAP